MKKTISWILVITLMLGLLCSCSSALPQKKKKIVIGVTVYDQYDTFISSVMTAFKDDVLDYNVSGTDITVKTYNAGGSQQTQNEQVREMLANKCDVLCVNLVDRTAPTEIITAARAADIPIIFFNRELVTEDLMQWDKLYYVGADAFESGIMQGEIASDFCRMGMVDKNHDSMTQYVVFEGEAGHQDAVVRSEYSVKTLINNGVRLEKIGYAIANWDRAQAQTKMSQFIDEYGTEIELVLANNDDMALGVIDALKNAKVERDHWPVIIGIDGTDAGLQAIIDGNMSGTVYNDKEGQARAMLELAVCLAKKQSVDSIDLDGRYVRLPYNKVTAANAAKYAEIGTGAKAAN